MKTIILFHRLELTELFIALARELQGRAQIVHLAYGPEEAQTLRNAGIAGEIAIFKEEVAKLYPATEAAPENLRALDDFILQGSAGAFNLNAAIQSDRGFSLLSLDEAQKLTLAYHRFWGEFLARHTADAILHEPCTLMFNFIAAMHCAARGGDYLYPIMAQGPDKGFHHLLMSGFDFTCSELDRQLAGRPAVDPGRAAAFLAGFRKDFAVFLAGAFKRPSLLRLSAMAVMQAVRGKLRQRRYDRVLDNIDYWQMAQRPAANKLRNLIAYRRHIRFDPFEHEQRYYFYPLHLEPEAVVLYHAHGLYANQIKLVQNIAAQLPPDTYLYVKDHPHDQGYRAAADYAALQAIPNIRLLDAGISGKEITAHSEGVITLTGSAGFEALLLGKRVFTFGKTFYSAAPGVTYLRHVRDLREALYQAETRPFLADEALHPWLTAYFTALHPGLTDYFAGRHRRYGIDLDANAAQVAEGILRELQAAA